MTGNGKNIKTISSTVKIDMVDELLQFHNKGNIVVDNNFYHRLAPHTLTRDQFSSLEYSDFEIVPFHDDAITCVDYKNNQVRRQRSASKFADENVSFSVFQSLLTQSFSMKNDKSRPYPSGGALYPVEVICAIFSEKIIDGPPSGIYHYRPTLQILQPVKQMTSDDMRDLLFRIELPSVNSPNFAILYMGVLGKILVKYRYRGYRYALMETGAMFHQADLVSKELGLRNKLYSGFNDHEIMKGIGLDRMNFLPFVIQSFGVQHANNT